VYGAARVQSKDFVTMSEHTAAGPMAGYMYQVRYALLVMLRGIETDPNLIVRLETIDDISTEEGDGSGARLSLKHHQPDGVLSDMSVDWWKTLNIWVKGWDPAVSVKRLLVTTARCLDGSAGAMLRPNVDQADEAHDRLVQAAQASQAEGTRQARESFLGMTELERRNLIASVQVIDSQPTIEDLVEALVAQLVKVAGRSRAHLVLEQLEGWWLALCASCLMRTRAGVAMSELDTKLDDLRFRYVDDSLPLDDELFVEDIADSEFLDRAFVKQLEIISVGRRRVLFAVRDYWRAYTQRSKWLEDGLVEPGELSRYERRLCEAWDGRFEAMKDALGQVAAEEAMRREARELYAWAENDAQILIRPRVTESALVKGSFHMLSDDLRVGWHPEFAARLMGLLETTSAS
jgi:hypothetical protein